MTFKQAVSKADNVYVGALGKHDVFTVRITKQEANLLYQQAGGESGFSAQFSFTLSAGALYISAVV